MTSNSNKLIKKYFHGEENDDEYIAGIKPYTILEFLKQGANLKKKIPDYQRPYSWTHKELGDFLEDLKTVSKDSENKGWFIGSIYTSKKSAQSSVLNLLDGQQRITTIYLIGREIMNIQFYFDDDELEDLENDDELEDLENDDELEDLENDDELEDSENDDELEDSENDDELEDSENDENANPSKTFNLDDLSEATRTKYKSLCRDISECLYNSEEPRFETETDSNEFLEKYLKPREFDNYSKYVEWYKEIKKITEEDRSDFSETKITLSENIIKIREFINDIISNNDLNEAFEQIINIGDSLINKLFLIEIPLKEKKYSIEFFEALNNRGKPLSLIDRLVFKSISYLNNNDEASSSVDNYRKKWKDLYKLISKSVESQSFFSNHGEFYTNLFLSIGKREFNPGRSGKTKQDLYVDYFEKRFLNKEAAPSEKQEERLEDTFQKETLETFFKQSTNIISFINSFQKPSDSDFYKLCEEKINSSSETAPKKEIKKEKAKALLRLMNTLIPATKPSIYLIMNLIYLNDPTEKGNVYNILQGLYSIVKISMWRGIIMEIDSNAVRSGNHKLNKYITRGYKGADNQSFSNIWKKLLNQNGELNNSDFLDFISDRKVNVNRFPEFYKENHDLVSTIDNNKSSFLIYLFTYISMHKNLTKYENKIYLKKSLEHIWPKDWKEHWNIIDDNGKETQYFYDNSKVFDYIDQKKFGEEEGEHKNVKNIKTALGEYENDTFKPNDAYIFKLDINQDEPSSSSLIQWIGNKVVIPGRDNSGLSNFSFSKKKKKIKENESNYKVLPCWDCEDDYVNIKGQTEWTYKEVIERSFQIVDKILSEVFIKPNSEWDSE